MINDNPGVYAKIIDEKRGVNFSFFQVFELQEIELKKNFKFESFLKLLVIFD